MPAGVANAGLINFTKALADEFVRDGILASARNSYISGTTIEIDGGATRGT